jgi:hypothetical protein
MAAKNQATWRWWAWLRNGLDETRSHVVLLYCGPTELIYSIAAMAGYCDKASRLPLERRVFYSSKHAALAYRICRLQG